MDDGATVPLFYEKRVPEVLIQNEDLSEEFYQILEDENLDDAQQEKLEKRLEISMLLNQKTHHLRNLSLAQDVVPRLEYPSSGSQSWLQGRGDRV